MPLAIHHLMPRDYKIMPWKNGGGSTTELAVYPRDGSVQAGFDWRISLADLEGSGPFSSFLGYDRIIAQISGEPMTLRHEGETPDKQLQRYVPYRFSGELITDCVLHGKAQDFNVMFRNGMTGNLEHLLFDHDALRREHKAGVSFIWVAYGSVVVHESSKGHDHRLDQHHALEIFGEYESLLTLKPRETDTVVFIVNVH